MGIPPLPVFGVGRQCTVETVLCLAFGIGFVDTPVPYSILTRAVGHVIGTITDIDHPVKIALGFKCSRVHQADAFCNRDKTCGRRNRYNLNGII